MGWVKDGSKLDYEKINTYYGCEKLGRYIKDIHLLWFRINLYCYHQVFHWSVQRSHTTCGARRAAR